MTSIIRMSCLFAVCLTVAVLMGGCAGEPPPPPAPVRPVKAYRVKDPALERLRTFAGTLRPALESELSFRVAGEIMDLPVKSGVQVRQGDLIARLDASDYELQVRQAAAQVNQADALQKQARSQYERVRELYESRNASKSELDQARAAFESAEAQLASAQKTLEMARLQVAYCSLTAPFDGAIISRPAEIYQAVSPGQTIATLAAGGNMEMVIAVPELLINEVHLGAATELSLDALPGRKFDAVVSEVGVATTSGKSAYPVRLTMLESVPEMRSGMVGEARLAFAEDRGVLHVPPVCVVSRPDGTRFVWVVTPAGDRAEQRTVRPGALTSTGLQILEGLQTGDLVVMRGVHRIEENSVLRIVEDEGTDAAQ
ncbi:MAG: efflux RND transporter periplasmic adaptor subunit [Kiritimatiellia bacterium]